VLAVACGGGGSADDRQAVLDLLGATCADEPSAIYDVALPAAAVKGDVLGCAYDRKISVAEMQAHFQGTVPPITTAVYKLRLAYVTERGPGERQITSAALFVPEVRRGDPPPLVVAGHGSVGLADACAPSREDPQGFLTDFRTQIYTLAGDGWVVLAPDFPGLGTAGPTTWQLSLDEGHALLDGTRAARRLARAGFFSEKNAIVGHSNGGHAALSAQAFAADYGTEGSVEAVLVWAPLWISNGAWGALTTPLAASLVTPAFMSMTLMYFYGHGMALDGGTDGVFLADQQDAIASLLEGGCWQRVTRAETGPPSIGISTGPDGFVSEFITEVGTCALSGTSCDSPTAMTWRARWAADRPPPDPAIPIVLWQGAADDFLTPAFQQCGIDRLVGQGADLTLCVSAQGDHGSVMPRSAEWVHQYLAARLLAGPEPAACIGAFDPPVACGAPLPNSVDPDDP